MNTKTVIRESRIENRKLPLLCSLILSLCSAASADNTVITNPDTQPIPVKNAAVGGQIQSTSKEASHIIRAFPAKLSILTVTSDSDQYILIMDSATLPGDGAVTLLHPPIHVSANSTTMINFPIPLVAVNGITVCNSNANSFTKTIGSANCIFYARWQ